MKKIIYTLLGLIIVIVAIAVFSLNPVGKKYTQEYAQNLLKTPVKINQFDVSILDKSLNINFIEVQNPPNFNNKNAFSLDHFSLKIGDNSDDNLIVVDKLNFDGLGFSLDQNGSNVNLTHFINTLKAPQNTGSSTKKENSSSEDIRIKIKQFSVNNIRLKVDTKWLKKTLKVPNISAHNFGGNSGIEVNEIGKEIGKEILNHLKKALEEQGIEAGKKEIEASLRRKIEQKLGIEDGLDSIKKQFDTDEIKNKAKGLLQNLGF